MSITQPPPIWTDDANGQVIASGTDVWFVQGEGLVTKMTQDLNTALNYAGGQMNPSRVPRLYRIEVYRQVCP